MNCPNCKRKFTAIETSKFYNPHRIKCVGCKTLLSLHLAGLVCGYLFLITSAFMLGLYIYQAENDIGSATSRAAIFWGYLIPATALYLGVIFRWGVVLVKKDK